MQRIAFVISVKPEKLEEYKKLHDPIWPELTAELKKAGLRNYSLWMLPEWTSRSNVSLQTGTRTESMDTR